MPLYDFVAQPNRRVNGFIASFCPHGIASYATIHLDSIAKILNHILIVMGVFNFFLFLASWSVSFLPRGLAGGMDALFISFLLICQNICLWMILNNNNSRISVLSFLSPTEFMLGVALGITIGAALLSFLLSGSYRRLANCDRNAVLKKPDEDHTLDDYLCQNGKGTALAIWFWAGLVFWLNFWSSLLLSTGRRELTSTVTTTQYDPIGMEDPMNQYPQVSSPQHYQQQPPLPPHHFGPIPHSQQPLHSGLTNHAAFVGDYANVPEIRSGEPQSVKPITQAV